MGRSIRAKSSEPSTALIGGGLRWRIRAPGRGNCPEIREATARACRAFDASPDFPFASCLFLGVLRYVLVRRSPLGAICVVRFQRNIGNGPKLAPKVRIEWALPSATELLRRTRPAVSSRAREDVEPCVIRVTSAIATIDHDAPPVKVVSMNGAPKGLWSERGSEHRLPGRQCAELLCSQQNGLRG